MAHSLSVPTRKARCVARLDTTRIGAETGTIAINAALLLLLLVPVAPRLVEPAPRPDDMHLAPIVRVPPRIEPPPPLPVETQPATPVPVTRAEPPSWPRQEAAAVDTVAPVTGDIPGDPIRVEPAPPLEAGAGLQRTADVGASLRALAAPPPPYPREALAARLEGTVVFDVHVNAEGRPVDVVVVTSSGHRALDRAAQRQVMQKWRFRPALRDGRAVPALGRVPVTFVLDR